MFCQSAELDSESVEVHSLGVGADDIDNKSRGTTILFQGSESLLYILSVSKQVSSNNTAAAKDEQIDCCCPVMMDVISAFFF